MHEIIVSRVIYLTFDVNYYTCNKFHILKNGNTVGVVITSLV